MLVATKQDSTRWGPARLLAGGAVLVNHGMLIAILATSARFPVIDGAASMSTQALMYVYIAPSAPRTTIGTKDQRASRIITLPDTSATPIVLPIPIIAIPDVDVPRVNWIDEAHLAGVAEFARERSAQGALATPSGAAVREIDPSGSSGTAAWDAAKPKGLELDDSETRLWVNEHCYLFVGQPAPQQNLGAKCRLGSATAPNDLFDGRRAKVPFE